MIWYNVPFFKLIEDISRFVGPLAPLFHTGFQNPCRSVHRQTCALAVWAYSGSDMAWYNLTVRDITANNMDTTCYNMTMYDIRKCGSTIHDIIWHYNIWYVKYFSFIDLSQTNFHTCSWSENSNNLHPRRPANNAVKLSWLLVAGLQKEFSGNLCATKQQKIQIFVLSLIKIKAIALLTEHENIFDWLNKTSYEWSKNSKWDHLISAVWSLSLNIFTFHTVGGILVKVGVKLVSAMPLYSPVSQRKCVQRKYDSLISKVLPCEYWGWVLNSHNKNTPTTQE